MASNTAIFYDIENLMGIFNGKTNTGLHLDEIYRRVLAMDGVTGVSIQRAYADWAVPMYRNLRNSVLQVGIEPIQIFNTNQNDRVKNAADVSLIIDAVDLAARRPEIDNFVIASGDGIFAFLSKKLHEHGKRVIGCGFEKVVNMIFRNSCDYFIALEKADESIIVTATNRSSKPEPVKAAEVSVAEKKEKKVLRKKSVTLPKTKYTEILLASGIVPPQDTGDVSSIMNMVRQMVDALFVEGTKDLPGLEISIFANYISHYLPSFKVRSLGFKGIGEFMRFMLTGSQYCTYSVADNVVLMAPRATAEAANGKIVDEVNGLLIVTSEGERYNSVFNVTPGMQFVYTVQKQDTAKPKKSRKSAQSKKTKNAELPQPVETVQVEEGTIRKVIKEQFDQLSAADALPPTELSQLTKREYSLATFGVRAPILREIDTQKDLREQRTLNGKVKYWKEPFVFHGKQYLIYKEWANLHKKRFIAWCAGFKPIL
ncbi:MAG: NYN domain-containing protein [Firmicutes bacterium]|nr:NYN domain-containing protein [Bacillota bacterium]